MISATDVGGWAAAATIPVVVVAILCSMIANELTSYGTKLGLWIVRLAVRMLPAEVRERYQEEWSADVLRLSEDGHRLTALVWGLATIAAATRKSRLVSRGRVWVGSDDSRSILTVLTLILASSTAAVVVGGELRTTAAGLTVGVSAGFAAERVPLNASVISRLSYGWGAATAILYIAVWKVSSSPADIFFGGLASNAGLVFSLGLSSSRDIRHQGDLKALRAPGLGYALAFGGWHGTEQTFAAVRELGLGKGSVAGVANGAGAALFFVVVLGFVFGCISAIAPRAGDGVIGAVRWVIKSPVG